MNVTIKTNVKIVNFIDVTFHLCTGRYHSYKKPNDELAHVKFNPNNLPNIIKVLPANIPRRISHILHGKAAFSNLPSFQKDILSTSGYKKNLTYKKDLPTLE